ncbi:MAG: DUF4445 domain-containing protein [Gammaproteobacteria bacterium]|nr:DUF4445 domain-containing protein [Gammaproteobacteria bacterium]
MSNENAKVVFTPSGRRGSFPLGTKVLEAARSLGVDVDSVCGGRGLCGRCQVRCAEGDFPKHAILSRAEHLSRSGDAERQYGERRKPLADGRRLSCQAEILGDLVIDVPAESQMHRQVVRKGAEYRDITLESTIHLYYVEVKEASLDDATGDLERLLRALVADWQLTGLDVDPAVLANLQQTLRDGKWRVTVAVHKRSTIIAVWPGLRRDVFGLAVDIGSTTIAAQLCNLATGDVVATDGIMNPQIRFGEDLMSRVSYVMMNEYGARELTDAVRAGLNELVVGIASDAGVAASDILEATIAGNPIMHHLFLGLSPVELGGAPFALATDRALDLRARELGLDINAGGVVYVLPCIAGHVGADAAAMILSEEPHLLDEISLVVDVGTNAEIILGNRDRLFACSSPTGPAFEGAQISCGQRAAPGAIERVRIDAETFDAHFSVIGSELWSDDPGFADATAGFGVSGICGSGIIEAVAEMYLAGLIDEDGVIDGGLADRTSRLTRDGRTWTFVLHDGSPSISVTQNDVRQIQLAKAALYAGVKLLMDAAGLDSVDRIRLAGAFGSHIDPKYAMVLGLVPDCALEKVESAGNAAGTGARIALLNKAAREEIESVVRGISKIETATEPNFQDYFVTAMAIPHKCDRFDKLFSVVAKPAPKKVRANTDKPRGRRRKRAS